MGRVIRSAKMALGSVIALVVAGALAGILVGCGGMFGPDIKLNEEQASDPMSSIKVKVIEAQSVVLATYKSIPANLESGLWNVEFAGKVYAANEDLETAVGLVEAAIKVGNSGLASERALAMMELLGALKTLTAEIISYGNENQRGSTVGDIRPGGFGGFGSCEPGANQTAGIADGRRWAASGFGYLLHENRNRGGERAGQNGNRQTQESWRECRRFACVT